MVTRAPQGIKSEINSALRGTCKAILEPQEIKPSPGSVLQPTSTAIPVHQENRLALNTALRETPSAPLAPQENKSALNNSLRGTPLITLTPQEITILKDPTIGPGIKNNFAANKLNNDDLIVCRQLAMEPAAMLLAKYEEQELKAYNSRLAASQFS